MGTFEEKVKKLGKDTVNNNKWRRHDCINLIPSENPTSLIASLMEISDPAGRYAEHTTIRGKEVYYYEGIQFIEETEQKLVEELKNFFNNSQIEPRVISGTMANRVVYEAIVKTLEMPMWYVLSNALINGGHLTHKSNGTLYNLVDKNKEGKPNVLNFPIREDNPYKIDTSKLDDLIISNNPDLIILGKSMFLFPEPVKEIREIIDANFSNDEPLLMYDMAHVLGLYGAFQSPLDEGADILTGSTHKTFFGPQRGIIAGNINEDHPVYNKLWKNIKQRTFPGNQSNHHLGTLLSLLMATYEMNEFKEEYQTQVIKNAKAFAKALDAQGITVEGKVDGYTETHQVVIDVRKHGGGKEIAQLLECNNIITNYQGLPHDKSINDPSGFNDPSGIRMGVQEMTRYGMKEKDFETLAGYMAAVIKQNKIVTDDVIMFRAKFREMQYCLETKKTLPLAAELFTSLMPNSQYALKFAENLIKTL